MRDDWFYTSGIGRADPQGYLAIEERKEDMIEASGESVLPAEVEAITYRHPAVAEVGAVGVPDPYREGDVTAIVVRKPGTGLGKPHTISWCRDELAVYKAPRTIRFVRALPNTGCGKILKRDLSLQARDA